MAITLIPFITANAHRFRFVNSSSTVENCSFQHATLLPSTPDHLAHASCGRSDTSKVYLFLYFLQFSQVVFYKVLRLSDPSRYAVWNRAWVYSLTYIAYQYRYRSVFAGANLPPHPAQDSTGRLYLLPLPGFVFP